MYIVIKWSINKKDFNNQSLKRLANIIGINENELVHNPVSNQPITLLTVSETLSNLDKYFLDPQVVIFSDTDENLSWVYKEFLNSQDYKIQLRELKINRILNE